MVDNSFAKKRAILIIGIILGFFIITRVISRVINLEELMMKLDPNPVLVFSIAFTLLIQGIFGFIVNTQSRMIILISEEVLEKPMSTVINMIPIIGDKNQFDIYKMVSGEEKPNYLLISSIIMMLVIILGTVFIYFTKGFYILTTTHTIWIYLTLTCIMVHFILKLYFIGITNILFEEYCYWNKSKSRTIIAMIPPIMGTIYLLAVPILGLIGISVQIILFNILVLITPIWGPTVQLLTSRKCRMEIISAIMDES